MLGTEYKLLGFLRPYGLCMALGIVLCFLFLMFMMNKKNFNDESQDKILLFGIFATGFGILMAAIVQGIYEVIAGGEFSLGAMTFFGGLIGGVASFLIAWNIYVFVIARSANNSENPSKVKILGTKNMNATLTDALPFIPIGITIAHAFGRLGCTMAGCCYGAEADWGIPMYVNGGGLGIAGSEAVKVVPTQLFECIFLLLLSAIMLVLYLKFNFKDNFGLYAIVYGIWRFGIEYARDDWRAGVQDIALTPSQIWSIVMVALGIGYFFLSHYVLRRFMRHPELQPPVRVSKKKAAEPAGAPAPEEVVEKQVFVPEERLVLNEDSQQDNKEDNKE